MLVNLIDGAISVSYDYVLWPPIRNRSRGSGGSSTPCWVRDFYVEAASLIGIGLLSSYSILHLRRDAAPI